MKSREVDARDKHWTHWWLCSPGCGNPRMAHWTLFFPLSFSQDNIVLRKQVSNIPAWNLNRVFTIRVNRPTDLLASFIWINFNVWKLLSNTLNNKRFQGQEINDPWPYLREIVGHRKARWLKIGMGTLGNTLNHFHVLLFHCCSQSIWHYILLGHLLRSFHQYLN